MTGPLGILDWGIGGLDLLKKLRARGSSRDIRYWSDAGAPPYGTLSEPALAERLATVIDTLSAEGCAQVVVACNAASTALHHPLLHQVGRRRGVAVVGVIAPTLAAIEARGLRRVAVIGGRRTIESEAYAAPLRARGVEVSARIAQPLSALVERGVTDGPELDACLQPILEPLRDAEHLILACTHYVAVRAAIEQRLPRLRSVLDPAAETLHYLDTHWGDPPGSGRARFVTTGDPEASRRAAAAAFGLTLPPWESRGFKSA